METEEFYKIDVSNPHNLKEIENLDLGGAVLAFLNKHKDIPFNELSKFRLTCLSFYQELCVQIRNRFPFDNNKLKYLIYLLPKNIKEKKNPSISLLACHFHFISESELNELDREWKLLSNLREEEIDFSKDFEDFWIDISLIRKKDSELMFPLLVKLVNFVRILPHSTATVERIFSIINLNKTKTRNALSTSMLSGVLHTKKFFKTDKVCYNFDINSDILSKNWKEKQESNSDSDSELE